MTAAVAAPLRRRMLLFWIGCAAISAGVALHLPMLAMAHQMGNHLYGMPMDAEMYVGMALIALGLAAIDGRPFRRLVRRPAVP